MRISDLLKESVLNEENDLSTDMKIVGEIRKYMKKFDYVECIVKAMRNNDTDHKNFFIAFTKSSKRLFMKPELIIVKDGAVSCFDFNEQNKIQNLTPDGNLLFQTLFAFNKALIMKYAINDIKLTLGLVDTYKETGKLPPPPEEGGKPPFQK